MGKRLNPGTPAAQFAAVRGLALGLWKGWIAAVRRPAAEASGERRLAALGPGAMEIAPG
jgi:hypothetical protein